jgi:4-methylaminobutanoate oxidase (formaldehyde-forming)
VIWKNEAGRVRSAVSILLLSSEEAIVLSSAGSERLHSQWLEGQGIAASAIRIVTSAYARFLLLGPQADARLNGAEAALCEGQLQSAEIGYAPVMLVKTSLGVARGWDVLVSTEFALHAYEALQSAGPIKLAGAYATDALRISAGHPAWPSELGDTVTPREAGLVGTSGGKRTTALVQIALKDDAGALYGQEGILCDGKSIGLTTSGAWCRKRKVPVALGYVSNAGGVDAAWIKASRFEIDRPGGPAAADVTLIGEA